MAKTQKPERLDGAVLQARVTREVGHGIRQMMVSLAWDCQGLNKKDRQAMALKYVGYIREAGLQGTATMMQLIKARGFKRKDFRGGH